MAKKNQEIKKGILLKPTLPSFSPSQLAVFQVEKYYHFLIYPTMTFLHIKTCKNILSLPLFPQMAG